MGDTTFASWNPYLDFLFAYAVEGQSPVLERWATQVNVGGAVITRWYHVPWMAYDIKAGREFIHGTTNERTASRGNFVDEGGNAMVLLAARPGQAGTIRVGENPIPDAPDTLYETWAVGMYNPVGAYAIGRAIPASGVPQSTVVQGNAALPLRFPNGSMVVKVLFTTADSSNAGYLRGAPRWTVNRHIPGDTVHRSPQPATLIQMDLAARDDRSPTGWVYATYAYDGTSGPATGPWWRRMRAVGVQWGNDPQSYPAVDSTSSKPLAQSAINHGIGIYEHIGCYGRLAGPVDNPQSSCMSCHQGAVAPAPVGTPATETNVPPIFVFPPPSGAAMCMRSSTTTDSLKAMNTAYFQNVLYPGPYPAFPGVSGKTINLDTSLQLLVAYKQYANWLAAQDVRSRR
ncbi:MAG: hypothetical protein JO306_03805 [Gemmatimonadetes bacterium]|nr:hypothetical protein [Gemmatimonadota bacterium]